MTEGLRSLAVPLAVTALGVSTAFAGPTETALELIRAEARVAMRHPVFVGPDGLRQICAPAPHCLHSRDAVERLLALYQVACQETAGAMAAADITLAVLPWWLRRGSPFRPALDRALQEGRLGPGRVELVTGDAAAGAAGVFAAAQLLARGEARRVAVVAADTAIAPAVLDMNEASGFAHTRQTRHNPFPGEAAVALVLAANHEGAAGLTALIEAPEPLRPMAPDRGLMGQVSAGLLARLVPPDGPFNLVADLDGERYRSEEFGVVCSRLPEPGRVIVPALSLGYVGTATLALQIAVALGGADRRPSLCWTIARSGLRMAAQVIPDRKG